MSDDLLDRLEALPGPLVPYQCGLPCWHQLRAEAGAHQGGRVEIAPAGEAALETDAVSA
jgi:hypothetical protein